MEVIVEELESRKVTLSVILDISKVFCIVLTIASCSKNYIRMGFKVSYSFSLSHILIREHK